MKHILTLFISIICLLTMTFTVYAQRDLSKEEMLANELKELGLFYGVSETDFDLDRAPTRVEAVVMLIRVLGKESEAKEGTWKHPFTDVPEWADNYIGYAYSKGLANGQALTEFGVGQANAAMYITFVLRALGYSDTNGADFVWDKPFDLAKQVGILPVSVNLDEFWRSDVVIVSHTALSAHLKGTTQPLYQKLISAGMFTKEKYDNIYNSNGNITEPKKELTSEDIYAKCSPAVFYIEIYDKDNVAISSGSGFFINSYGVAVTNFHVIENAYSAKIQISETEQVFDVIGVYGFSKKNDWAVMQIDCINNQYLEIGDSSTIVGASNIYTIGSPLGLQNTISQGIISNPKRVINDVTFIQISAAISHGSSGGALLNKYGEVIGITSAGYDEGQNLNLAIPISYIDYTEDDLIPLHSIDIPLCEYNHPRDYLISILKRYGVMVTDNTYKLDYPTQDNTSTFMAYDEDDDLLYIADYRGEDLKAFSMVELSASNSNRYSVTLSDKYGNTTNEIYGHINVSLYSENSGVQFEKYTGLSYERSYVQDYARGAIWYILIFTHEYISHCTNNEVSLIDFGYNCFE